jgi:hypothetical protein
LTDLSNLTKIRTEPTGKGKGVTGGAEVEPRCTTTQGSTSEKRDLDLRREEHVISRERSEEKKL